jgi:hypothetical protein
LTKVLIVVVGHCTGGEESLGGIFAAEFETVFASNSTMKRSHGQMDNATGFTALNRSRSTLSQTSDCSVKFHYRRRGIMAGIFTSRL